MKLHKASEVDPSEPSDGWETGPTLESSEILSIALCKYTGFIIDSIEQGCPWQEEHTPGPCVTLYHSAAALAREDLDIANLPADVVIVRADFAAGDVTGQSGG